MYDPAARFTAYANSPEGRLGTLHSPTAEGVRVRAALLAETFEEQCAREARQADADVRAAWSRAYIR